MWTAWSPCRAYGPTGCCVACTDRVVAMSSIRTDWLPCHADRVVTLLSVPTGWLQRGADRVVAASCGPRGHLVMCTDALDTV